MDARTQSRVVGLGAVLVGLIPLGYLALDWFVLSGPWVNPVEFLLNWSGLSGISLLTAGLAITPARRLTGFNPLVKARRTVGLFAYGYVLTHFLVYAVLDQGLALEYIAEDIAERPFILFGTSALVLLTPLALTSTKGWIRRLGKNWARLHRLVYLATALGALHFFLAVKLDTRWPLIVVGILAVLMVLRIPGVLPGTRRKG